MSVLSNLKTALSNLNGAATLKDIYDEYAKITGSVVDSTIRRTLQQNSSDSTVFTGKNDVFLPSRGLETESGDLGITF